MRGRNYKLLRRAADDICALLKASEHYQGDGQRHRAAHHRWLAARRALWAEAAARQAYGLPLTAAFQALGEGRSSDYLQ